MAWLRQRDGVTCGPSVAVMAGTLLDADYGEPLRQQRAQQWFDSEQRRVHRSVNMVWPRALGTTPADPGTPPTCLLGLASEGCSGRSEQTSHIG